MQDRSAEQNPIIALTLMDGAYRIISALIDVLQDTCIINHVADNKSELTYCVTLSYQISSKVFDNVSFY